MKAFSRFDMGPRVRITCGGDGRTKQSQAAECDINLIMAKYAKTGLIDHFSKHGAEYGFADAITFHEAMNVVSRGNSMFEDLPAEARQRFVDPAGFLDFVQDPENQGELFKLGLADKAPEKPVTPPAVATTLDSPGSTVDAPSEIEPDSAL